MSHWCCLKPDISRPRRWPTTCIWTELLWLFT